MSKRRLRPVFRYIFSFMFVGLVLLVFFITMKTVFAKPEDHNHTRYKYGRCVVYYPNNETIAEYAKGLCPTKDKNNIDFVVSEAGDYQLVEYPNKKFYVNKDFSDITFNHDLDLDIMSSEIRFQMRKDNIDEAYTSKFMIDTSIDNLDLSNITINLIEDNFFIDLPTFNYQLLLPLELGQLVTGTNFGVESLPYQKQIYINPNRPMLAITYDDGPYKPVDESILETMNKYDARCTFYYVGNRMGPTSLQYSTKAIEQGFEYGSHTEGHAHLAYLSASDAKATLYQVNDYFKEKINYEMKTYRPPYGERNLDMEEIINIPAILWNVDSRDWANRDKDITYDNIMSIVDDNDVILMHSLYESSAEATKKLVPDLIDQGYQLVTVSDLMKYLGIKDVKVFRGN